MFGPRKILALVISIACLFFAGSTLAAEKSCMGVDADNQCFSDLIIDVGGSEVLDIDRPTKQMKFVTSSDKVIDVRPFKENKLYIRGKEVGHSTLTIYDQTNGETVAKIEVDVKPLATVSDLTNLKKQIGKAFPGQDINIDASQKGIVLYGTVTGPEIVEQVLRLADGYLSSLTSGLATSTQRIITLPGGQTIITEGKGKTETGRSGGKIINLLKVGGPQQVLLEVKFAEVNRNSTRELEAGIGLGKLGSDFSGGVSSSGSVITPVEVTNFPGVAAGGSRGVYVDDVPGRTIPTLANAPGSLLLNLTNGANVFVNIDNFTLMLRFLEQERLGRILAEPKLVTLSGQEASFLVGGEFPYTTVNANGQADTEFKDFGIGLRFTPVVGSDGLITLKVAPSVSSISEYIPSGAGGTQAAFNTRKLESMVQLRDGQTLALAGLLEDNLSEVVNKVPLLGDIPILGTLFRSTNYQHKKTDLLIAVTPHLVKPVQEGKISFPGEFIKPPNRFEHYLLGALEGFRSGDDPSLLSEHKFAARTGMSEGGMEGNFGHMESAR